MPVWKLRIESADEESFIALDDSQLAYETIIDLDITPTKALRVEVLSSPSPPASVNDTLSKLTIPKTTYKPNFILFV